MSSVFKPETSESCQRWFVGPIGAVNSIGSSYPPSADTLIRLQVRKEVPLCSLIKLNHDFYKEPSHEVLIKSRIPSSLFITSFRAVIKMTFYS